MDDNRQFSWWAGEGTEPEGYTVNEATRDAVIAAARREFGDTVTFTIVEATQDGPWNVHPFDDALIDSVVESFEEDNGERFGEDGSEIDREGLAAALNSAFAAYVAVNEADLRAWAFTEERNKEVVPSLHRRSLVNDGEGRPYSIVTLEDGVRIDAAYYPHMIDKGRENPVPDAHQEAGA